MEAAREILAKVFGVRLSEVDEMIWIRLEAEDEAPEDGGYGLKSSGWKADVGSRTGRLRLIHNAQNGHDFRSIIKYLSEKDRGLIC
ncbi:hypothetical protein A7K50_12450 [Dehalobacter sp. MCB1]|uniref:hypothetical protein n=1 Tax=Dehalobacter sp. MCB1 TaxID=1844756 RepID=UPI000E6D2CEB|nr:hypothetical protein [Dehalobacter sp. MCB1]RJE46828.1 hypothetical protein A7K50_12450 [Dehalobacter sp. MCB1]